MKTKTINVYQYNELSDRAKERTRNWYLESLDFDIEWDTIKTDAETVGLALTEWEYQRNIDGDFIKDAEFCAQNIIKEHGEMCETYKTAKNYLEAVKTEETIEEIDADFLKSILEDYRIMADKQYEFVQSEEAISEMMEANEYEFDESGKRI